MKNVMQLHSDIIFSGAVVDLKWCMIQAYNHTHEKQLHYLKRVINYTYYSLIQFSCS